jgi:uncharacterized protein YbjT (DUF2867 family)
MILVIGASGQSGAAAVSALVARNMPVRVLMRPRRDTAPVVPAGCQLAVGDITRPDTLAAALDGVTAIVNCVGVGHDLRTRPATIEAVEGTGNRNLIDAAVAAGRPPHVVYLSALMAERAPYARPFAVKWLTEAALRASGLPFTILRPSNLTESIAGDFVSNGVASLAGRFPYPTSPISVNDLGQIAARCAAEIGPSGRVHDLFGPQTLSFPDVIRHWAAARGETVKFRSMPLPAFRVLAAAAAPARPLLPVIYSLIRSFNELDWSGDAAESRRLAGDELLSVEDAARRQPDHQRWPR